MKNAATYEKKIKKLLSGAKKPRSGGAPTGDAQFHALIEAVLQEDATPRLARQAADKLLKEFVDLNELRVCPGKDILDSIGRDYAAGREKAESLVLSLNNIFDKTCTMTMDWLAKLNKKDMHRQLIEAGLSSFAAGLLMMEVFDLPCVPVDAALVMALELNESVEPGSGVAEVQAFLDRIIPAKNAAGAHEAARALVEKHYKVISKRLAEQRALLSPAPRVSEEVDEFDLPSSARMTPAPVVATPPPAAKAPKPQAKPAPKPDQTQGRGASKAAKPAPTVKTAAKKPVKKSK